MIKGVICDVDGTIVDSNDQHATAWQEAFREFGIILPWDKIRAQIGKGPDQLIPEFLTPEQISRFGDQVEKKKDRIYKKKYLDQVKGLPGVYPFFKKLHEEKKTIVLATSGGANEIRYYTRLLGVEKWVRDIVSADDVARSKPYPDIFHIVLDRFQLKPSEAIVIGDTPYDVFAAKKLGLAALALLTGGFSDQSLREAGASEVYKDLSELLERYGDSRLGSG